MRLRSSLPIAVLLSATACSPAPFHPPATPGAESASPLGPSYVLVPLPSDDESLLGRVLPEAPRPGHSLEETARPNPCASALTQAKTMPLASTFEDAQDVAAKADAKAMLGVFGFESDVSRASHFFYKIETSKRVALTDTSDYAACCAKTGGCGVGFVSALVYGDGEYATAEETAGGAQINVAAASGGGTLALKILHRRKVHGYLAALVTTTASQPAASALGVLGAASVEPTIPERVREQYERDKVSIREIGGGDWVLTTGIEALTENEFVRRYGEATHSDELAGAKTRKNTGTVIVLGIFSAAAIYGTYWGLSHLKTACTTDDVECWQLSPTVGSGTSAHSAPPPGGQCVGTDCVSYVDPTQQRTNVGGILAASLSGAVALSVVPLFVYSLVSMDGTPLDHSLTQDDARRYVTRYNRAMLKKAGERVDHELRIERGAELRVVPIVGPGTIGLGGTF